MKIVTQFTGMLLLIVQSLIAQESDTVASRNIDKGNQGTPVAKIVVDGQGNIIVRPLQVATQDSSKQNDLENLNDPEVQRLRSEQEEPIMESGGAALPSTSEDITEPGTPTTTENKREKMESLYEKTPGEVQVIEERRRIILMDDNVEEAKQLIRSRGLMFEQDGDEYIIDEEGLNILKENGFHYNVIGFNVIKYLDDNHELDISPPQASYSVTMVDPYLSGSDFDDVSIPDYNIITGPGYAWSGVSLSGAPSGSEVTNLKGAGQDH